MADQRGFDELADSVTTTEVNDFFEKDNAEGHTEGPVADLLKVMKEWSKEYSKNLNDMREAIAPTVSEAWDMENDVVAVDTEPREKEHFLRMINTDNQQLNKVVMVFSAIIVEVNELKDLAYSKFFGPLVMFGVPPDPKVVETPEEEWKPLVVEMGNFIPFLQDLSNYVKRIYALVRNAINQLACLYHERQKLYISTFKYLQLPTVFSAIGELCRVLITIDALVADNNRIAEGWTAYKKMIKYARGNPDQYGLEQNKLRAFETLLLQLDRQIFSAKAYEGLLAQDYGLPGKQSYQVLVAGNRVLSEEMSTVIKLLLKKFEDDTEMAPREELVDIVGVYALYRRLFVKTAKPDKKLFGTIWELQKKIPVVPLYGRSMWFIAEFLNRYALTDAKNLNPKPEGVKAAREEYLNQFDADFTKEVEDLYNQMCTWMVRMESEFNITAEHDTALVLVARSKLFLNGIILANRIRNLTAVAIYLRLHLEKSFKAKNIRALAVCCEMLKAVEGVYRNRASMVGDNITHMLTQASMKLKSIFRPIKQALDAKSRLDDTKLDMLAAINLVLSLLDRPPTAQRRVVLNLALSIAQLKNALRQNHRDEVVYQVWKLEMLSRWQSVVSDLCNCDLLYWVSNLVTAFFDDIQKNPDQVHRLPYLFAAFRDPCRILEKAYNQPTVFARGYQAEVLSYFEQAIVEPVAREVETDLRLHIHSVILNQENLRSTTVKDLSRFLGLKPVYFFDKKIDIKQRVTHYLDSTFYNLTTVALHDWKVYAEMRNLASEKYGLKLTEVHLPGSSHYSDALDILEIMRNIHIFVSRYNYNMNYQIFVERAYDQKHLNTINILHIADSMRTHGTGIMNTTVNFTYQFLVRKFQLFSEFLFDDHIKSRLIKDIRFFKNEKEKLDNKYPFERTEKFNQGIKKLGVSEDGQTFLDQFRSQITEIGNALGYVRMVRSGGMHHTSNAIKFVPDLERIPAFAQAVDPTQLSPETKESARNLDRVLEELQGSFAEGTDYFQILVKIFQPVLLNETHAHLKNFFVIAPPLMLNFVEKMIGQKEKLNKKGGKYEAAFSDDGFALGLAYILRLLDQDAAFDSLHWFESVRAYLGAKQAEFKQQKPKKQQQQQKDDEQQIQLSSRRLESLETEFELLFYSFSGARIFFKDVGEEQVKKKKEEEAMDAAGGRSVDPLADAGTEGGNPSTPAPAPAPGAPGAPPPPPAPQLNF